MNELRNYPRLILKLAFGALIFIPPNTNFYRNSIASTKSQFLYSQPPLDGTFMQPLTLDYPDIHAYMKEINKLGMDTLIIQNIRTKDNQCVGDECCKSAQFRWLPNFPTKLGFILDQAADRGIAVYVGLDLTSHGLCPQKFYEEPNASLTIDDTRIIAAQVIRKYGHHPALAGWYLPDEPSLSEWIQPELAYDYYSGLVHSIRRVSSKPILISPTLVGIQKRTPQEMAYRALRFRNHTGVDIFLWQDSAGADGARLRWDKYSYSFADYIFAISDFMGKRATWSVHEAFNCCVTSSDSDKGAAYRPTSMIRLYEQLKEVRTAPIAKRIIWIQQHHFGSVDPTHHIEAIRLMESYRAKYELADEFVEAENYTWISSPDPMYDDLNFEMFNMRVGNPNDFTHTEWVGIDSRTTGRAEINIDLGTVRTIKWIGFHVLSFPQVGIHFPKSLFLACKEIDGNWSWMGYWSIQVEDDVTNSEYLFANPIPLNLDCRMIKASLFGKDWIFISEVEIVAESLETINLAKLLTKGDLLP